MFPKEFLLLQSNFGGGSLTFENIVFSRSAERNIKLFPCQIPLRPSDTYTKTGEELAVRLLRGGSDTND